MTTRWYWRFRKLVAVSVVRSHLECRRHRSIRNSLDVGLVEDGLVGELVEVAVAAGGDEGGEEDGEVVAGVDEGGGEDGAEADADGAEDEGDAEEQQQDGPGEGCLLAVKGGEENAGQDGGEDQGRKGDLVGGAPELVGGGGAREREPVIGYCEGG